MQIAVNDSSELSKAAQQILDFAGDEKVFLFYGEMGAGKTTLIHHICVNLGTEDHTSSPTFSIVNEYKRANGLIFHFDFLSFKKSK